MGFSDPRTVEATVLGWLPFGDEIVLVKPGPRRLRSTKSGARNWLTCWPMPAFLKRLQGSCREWIP
jgi:hypothetical protein